MDCTSNARRVDEIAVTSHEISQGLIPLNYTTLTRPALCDFVTVDCVVTLSSTGAQDDTCYVGCHGKVSHALPYPEPLRVTGPLQSLVLRAEDMWRKYKPFFIEVFGILNPGFPFSSLQCRQGMTPT